MEEAFRWHLRRLVEAGELRDDIVANGPWWTFDNSTEIDAVGLSGRESLAVLIGEAKWAARVRGSALVSELERRSAKLPRRAANPVYAVCARRDVGVLPSGALGITAADIFSP